MTEHAPQTNYDQNAGNVAPAPAHEVTRLMGTGEMLVVGASNNPPDARQFMPLYDRTGTAGRYGFVDPTLAIVHDSEGRQWPIIDILSDRRDTYHKNGGVGPRTLQLVKASSGTRLVDIDADIVVLSDEWNDRERGGREHPGGVGRNDVGEGQSFKSADFEVAYLPDTGVIVRALNPGVHITRMATGAQPAAIPVEALVSGVRAADEILAGTSTDDDVASAGSHETPQKPEAQPETSGIDSSSIAETEQTQPDDDRVVTIGVTDDTAPSSLDEAEVTESEGEAAKAEDVSQSLKALVEELEIVGDDTARVMEIADALLSRGESGVQAVADSLPQLAMNQPLMKEVINHLVQHESVQRILSSQTLANLDPDTTRNLVIGALHTGRNGEYLHEPENLWALMQVLDNKGMIADEGLRDGLKQSGVDYVLPGEHRYVAGDLVQFQARAVYVPGAGSYLNEYGQTVARAL